MRGAVAAPDVIVDFVFEEGLFFVAVTNIGGEPAEGFRSF
jgi:hypothetical protein